MPWSSNRPKASSTARGYGTAHQAERKRRLKQHDEHSPCGRCGRPLGPDRRRWHLPHNADRSGYEPGFWCAPCNLGDGAKRGSQRGNAAQRAKRQAAADPHATAACKFCGDPMAEGRTYCSQRCSYLANPNRERPAPKVRTRSKPRPFEVPTVVDGCALCFAPLSSSSRTYCSPECYSEANARNARERYRARVGLPPSDRPVVPHTARRNW